MNVLFRKKIIILIVGVIVMFGLFFGYKVGRTVRIVGAGESPFWDDVAALFPKIPDKEEDRIDILLLVYAVWMKKMKNP